MTASEIAETLLAGNIALARQEILFRDDYDRAEYEAAVMALDVAISLAESAPPYDYYDAMCRVRRCLEGAP